MDEKEMLVVNELSEIKQRFYRFVEKLEIGEDVNIIFSDGNVASGKVKEVGDVYFILMTNDKTIRIYQNKDFFPTFEWC